MAKKLLRAAPVDVRADRPTPRLLTRGAGQDRLCSLCASHNSPGRTGRGATVQCLPSARALLACHRLQGRPGICVRRLPALHGALDHFLPQKSAGLPPSLFLSMAPDGLRDTMGGTRGCLPLATGVPWRILVARTWSIQRQPRGRRNDVQSSLTQVRETEFPMVTEYTYLNTASQGPWPHRTVAAVQAAAVAMQYVNTPRGMPEVPPEADLARQRLAQLLHA